MYNIILILERIFVLFFWKIFLSSLTNYCLVACSNHLRKLKLAQYITNNIFFHSSNLNLNKLKNLQKDKQKRILKKIAPQNYLCNVFVDFLQNTPKNSFDISCNKKQ